MTLGVGGSLNDRSKACSNRKKKHTSESHMHAVNNNKFEMYGEKKNATPSDHKTEKKEMVKWFPSLNSYQAHQIV